MNKILGILWRSLLVGAAFVASVVFGGIIVNILGLPLPEARDAELRLLWFAIGGVITGLGLGPIAARMPATRARHLIVWSVLIFLNIASVAMEGYFFAPEIIGNALSGLLVQQLFVALAAGGVITILFAPQQAANPAPQAPRSVWSWAWRFIVSTLAYVVFYFIFGAINYALVTKPYYETHAGGLAVPAAQVTLAAEVVRGALIALSVLPFLLTARANLRRLMIVTGLLLCVIGGLVPLTMQVGNLPLFLLVASAWEIFFMNFPTGAVMARLLGRADAFRSTTPMTVPPNARAS